MSVSNPKLVNLGSSSSSESESESRTGKNPFTSHGTRPSTSTGNNESVVADTLARPSTSKTCLTANDDVPRLIFSKNSLRNASMNCDALGIHYRISTPTGMHLHRTTQLTRWIPRLEEYELVAEWERNAFQKDRYRILRNSVGDADFVPITDVFPKTSGLDSSFLYVKVQVS